MKRQGQWDGFLFCLTLGSPVLAMFYYYVASQKAKVKYSDGLFVPWSWYMCICLHKYAGTSVCLHACVCVYMYAYMHVFACMHISVLYVCMHVCVCVYVCLCTRTRVCVCMYVTVCWCMRACVCPIYPPFLHGID